MRLTSHRNLSILTTCFVSFSFLEEGGRLFLLHIIGLLPGSSPDYYTFKPLESCLQSMKGAVTVVWVTGQYRWFIIIIIISSSTSMNSSSRISIAIQKRTASYARIHIYIYIHMTADMGFMLLLQSATSADWYRQWMQMDNLSNGKRLHIYICRVREQLNTLLLYMPSWLFAQDGGAEINFINAVGSSAWCCSIHWDSSPAQDGGTWNSAGNRQPKNWGEGVLGGTSQHLAYHFPTTLLGLMSWPEWSSSFEATI